MTSKHISSAENPKIKLVLKLNSQTNARKKSGLFVIEGTKFIQDILAQSSLGVDFLIYNADVKKPVINQKTLQICQEKGIPVYSVEANLFKKMSLLKNSTGMLTVAQTPKWDIEKIKSSFSTIALLDSIQNPSNMGAIIRNATAFNISAVFYTPGSVDPFHHESIRAMAGNCFQTPIVECSEELLKEFLGLGANLYILDCNKNSIPLTDLEPTKKNIFVFGSEGSGIKSEFIKKTKKTSYLKIEMPGNVESLNVAVSSGVVFYVSSALNPSSSA
jgi:RNA methyltransferase, TrmH family